MSKMIDSSLFIDGQLVPAASGRTYQIIDPSTEDVAGTAADGGPEDMRRAIAAARRAFDETDWSTNRERRLKALRQFRDAIRANIEELRHLTATETGCTPGLTYGPQVQGPVDSLDYHIDLLESYRFEEEIEDQGRMGLPARRIIIREAMGVAGLITPWNYPTQINIAKAMPALAAGCTAILKPAPNTPWEAWFLGKMAAQCPDLPPGVFNVVTSADKAAVGEILTTAPEVDIISFTGSTGVGRKIMENASRTVKKVFLELGGKSAFIVLDDADFAKALPIASMVCFHAGQGCATLTRVLVPRSRQDEAVAYLEKMLSQFPYGDRSDMTQIMGPLANADQRDRVLAYIEKGKAEGARLVTGGGRPAHLPKGYYVEPTLFADVRNDMAIAQEEIFGPVLVVIPYEDEDDAVRIANDSIFGLSGAVASADVERAARVARRIRTGTIGVNGAIFMAPNAPFGGYKQSGIGREMGQLGFEEYLEVKLLALPAA
jgi:aldehyde dehydrogenase (NAD+)